MTSLSSPAAWYETLNPWDASDEFYLSLVAVVDSVIDVGCGTGQLLRRARANGHTGALLGVDPDPEMLAVARRHTDIDWFGGTAADVPPGRSDLVTMTGHAFQALTTDADLHASVDAIRGALRETGRFAFETRNPAVNSWTSWDGSVTVSVGDEAMTLTRRVTETSAEIVSFDETFRGRWWPNDLVIRSTLRFLHPSDIDRLLESNGFEVAEQYGDWDRTPLTESSPEIITIATLIT